MRSILALKVRLWQAPEVREPLSMLPSMEEDPIKAFAARLAEICEDKAADGFGAGRGQQTRLAKQFDLVPNAARKWLQGAGMPELPMAIRIANWAGVNVLWLLQGNGPKRGVRVSMASVVVDDALRAMPAEASIQILDFARFKLREQFARNDPRLARYELAVDTIKQAILPQGATSKRPERPAA